MPSSIDAIILMPIDAMHVHRFEASLPASMPDQRLIDAGIAASIDSNIDDVPASMPFDASTSINAGTGAGSNAASTHASPAVAVLFICRVYMSCLCDLSGVQLSGDISADLTEIARTPVAVVCAGKHVLVSICMSCWWGIAICNSGGCLFCKRKKVDTAHTAPSQPETNAVRTPSLHSPNT